jgi:hypothetical protein
MKLVKHPGVQVHLHQRGIQRPDSRGKFSRRPALDSLAMTHWPEVCCARLHMLQRTIAPTHLARGRQAYVCPIVFLRVFFTARPWPDCSRDGSPICKAGAWSQIARLVHVVDLRFICGWYRPPRATPHAARRPPHPRTLHRPCLLSTELVHERWSEEPSSGRGLCTVYNRLDLAHADVPTHAAFLCPQALFRVFVSSHSSQLAVRVDRARADASNTRDDMLRCFPVAQTTPQTLCWLIY